ncbi:hypothetical protein NMK54_34390 [Nocardia otitidiscaviarum]|uniref:hypothetical protein n=1 Tax=Nocardia otitidiscaviarum TaxID=1823 RepID=UPI0020CF21B9|nr:hypothetical protein [Nocardia otitidiscaviarum]MCP9625237.1 hypothetical protein [Nocardia otitidiscaviarum]
MSREPLPPPDFSGTDPNEVLRSRIDLTVGPPPTPAHTQVKAGTGRVRAGKGGTRPDPEGMRRTSFYITREAAEALERAADQIVDLLGEGTPRHVALSALLLAGANQVDAVAQELAQQRAAELAARLATLRPTPE